MADRPELTRRLDEAFKDILYEHKAIDLIRVLRWEIDDAKEARVTCITRPTSIEFGGRAVDEMSYPRLYNVELAFVREDDESMTCLAKSSWFARDLDADLSAKGWSLKQHNSDLGVDPFNVADMGDPAHDPARDIVMFFDGFIQPDILKTEGVHELLDTRGARTV